MIRVTVSYPAGEGKTFDHDYYQDKHRSLIQSTMTAHGLVRVEMDRCLSDAAGNAPRIVAAAHMVFATMDDFKKAMGAAGKTVTADVANYTNIAPEILISETLS